MKYTHEKLMNRRLFILLCGKIFIFVLIILRLYKLQIKNHKKYNEISKNNSTSTAVTIASRGVIFDKNGIYLALNKNRYQILYDKTKKNKASLHTLFSLLNLNQNETAKIQHNISSNTDSIIVIINNATWEQFYKTEINLHKLDGIYTDIKKIRFYPYQQYACHIVGYAIAQTTEFNKYFVNGMVGKSGLELFFNKKLTGIHGLKKERVNAYGLKVSKIGNTSPINGENIYTSIDIKMQQYAAEVMSECIGSMVVINLNNGCILSAYNNPSFDPNFFIKGIDQKKWDNIKNDKTSPLFNRFASNAIPPGSVFKLVTALAAIEENIISKDDIVSCTGKTNIGNRIARCWKRFGHGEVDMIDAISSSCNTYFYEIGKKINIDKLLNVAKEFGFGQKTNIEIQDENPGFIPTNLWRINSFKKKWFVGDTVNTVIGQGYMLSTPLQILTMIARIATGLTISPTLIHFEGKKQFDHIPFNENNLAIIRQGMCNAVNKSNGTAFISIKNKSLKIAGKTSTVQTTSTAGEDNDDNKTHAVFAGYAPFDNPKFAIIAVVEKAGRGSMLAAPRVEKMFKFIKNENIQ